MDDGPPRLLLGIDGGNTKTVALLAAPDGRVLGSARRLGCADPYAVGVDAAIALVDETVAAALDTAGSSTGAIGHAVASMAGADWPEDIDALASGLRARWPGPRVRVVNDAIGALRAAVPHGPGVVVVAGTGAATGARGPDGRTWHSSFWQEPQGARELAIRTVRALVRADLGIAPPTALTAPVLKATGALDVETLLHRQTRRGRERWAALDGLAGILLDAAAAGDATARAIVAEQGEALGRTALAAARRVGIGDGPFPLALMGGLFRHHGEELAAALIACVKAERPATQPVRAELPPVAGALLLAFEDAGLVVDHLIGERLRRSMPDDELYETRALVEPIA